MTLENSAILEVSARDREAAFVMREELDVRFEVERSYLLGDRGQGIRQIYDTGLELVPDEISEREADRRKGFHLDAGAGQRQISISFEYGVEETGQWGDGSGDDSFDATGSDPTHAANIFEYYMAQARSDSEGDTVLHYGEWTDGSFSLNAGAFGRPLPVAINSASVERNSNNPSNLEGTIDAVVTAEFPGISEFEDDIANRLASLIPD